MGREASAAELLGTIADLVRNEPEYTARLKALTDKEAEIREANGIYTSKEKVLEKEAEVDAYRERLEAREVALLAEVAGRKKAQDEAHAKRTAELDAKVAAERAQFVENTKRHEEAVAMEKANEARRQELRKWQADLEAREKKVNESDARLRSKAQRMKEIAEEVVNV